MNGRQRTITNERGHVLLGKVQRGLEALQGSEKKKSKPQMLHQNIRWNGMF